MQGKTNFSRRLKHFDDLTWLTPTPLSFRQIYAAAWGEKLSRLNTIPECDGQTDRRTDGQTDRISVSSSRVNNRPT